MYDQPIETKTVDQISAQPYALAGEYFWDNLNLSDDVVI
jgi:hypothetical protein